jgi:hypothetical protein
LDAGSTLVFAGDGGPVQVQLSAELPGGAVIHVLQWTESGNITLQEIEGSSLTGAARTRGKGEKLRCWPSPPQLGCLHAAFSRQRTRLRHWRHAF